MPESANAQRRPRLVFFQSRYDANAPEFTLLHKHEHVRCLQQFFDVTVVQGDCDYRQVCETHEPQLAVFETGLQLSAAHRLNITNARSCREVPKVAFLNADAGPTPGQGSCPTSTTGA